MLATSFAPVPGLGNDNFIQQCIDSAENEYSPREERFYLRRILEKIPQEIAAKRGADRVPEDLQYVLTRVRELREEFGGSWVQGAISSLALRALQKSPSHQQAVRNYINKAIKDPAVHFLTPLPERRVWPKFMDRVKAIAEEFYEDQTHSEYAVQVVANRIFSMQRRLEFKGDNAIRSVFAGNLRDFRLIKNQQKIDEQISKARDLAQKGIDKPGKYIEFWKKYRKGRRVSSTALEMENVWELGVGIAHAQGDRKTMEDTHVIGMIRPQEGFQSYANVYAVFDGHNGRAAAVFAQDKLIPYLQHHLAQQNNPDLTTKGNIFNGLKLAKVDLSEACKRLGDVGTTAAVVLRIAQKLIVANVGDSRVLINSSKLGFIQATEDAEIGAESFGDSLAKRGGKSRQDRAGEWRALTVNEDGSLAMARALGDACVPGVTARPKVTCYDLDELGEETQVLICCDGVFEGESSRTVLERADRLKKEGKNSKEIAGALVQAAYDSGSTDNITVMVVDLAD